MAKPNDIPLVYIFLYRKLKERAFGSQYLDTANLLEVLSRILFHTPGLNFRYAVLREMQDRFGLIKKINRMRYQILDSNCDDKLKNISPEELTKIILEINKGTKLKCSDDSIYKLIPNKCLRKLENINTWILG